MSQSCSCDSHNRSWVTHLPPSTLAPWLKDPVSSLRPGVSLEPCYLKYGDVVTLRSAVHLAGHVRTVRPSSVEQELGLVMGGCGAGQDVEMFIVQNSTYRSDTGPVMFSDVVSE
jgi:hypothetical protein